ncbi:uncharacterized protein LOC134250517 [Saccostrea cucullata]|uniref:uncharacterized protein LOC134250517 n=1 Tax=Saccostrea cuccullata TaxID=36930 RepID=UPI002ED3299D
MNREPGHFVYDRVSPRSEDDQIRDETALQIQPLRTESPRTCRPIYHVIFLSISITTNVLLLFLVHKIYFTNLADQGPAKELDDDCSIIHRRGDTNKIHVCLHHPAESESQVSSKTALYCLRGHESTIFLLKLMLDQKKKTPSSLFGLYEISFKQEENKIQMKSTLKRVPMRSLIPASANRIHLSKGGLYNVFGSMCFSAKDIREKVENVNIKLEKINIGIKETIINKNVTVHWNPNSYVDINFMISIWLRNETDLFLFMNHPNRIYNLPECNSIGIYKST